MRFCEMAKPPKKAGLAKLEFITNAKSCDGRNPKRINDTIIIPYRNDMEIFKLLPHWEQFLLKQKNRFNPHYSYEYFFGGTDENPFLVDIEEDAYEALLNEGVSGFYRSILPPRISQLAKQFEVDLKRQGDIFAMPLKWDREKMNDLHLLLYGEKMPEPKIKKQKAKQHVFKTRHVLSKGNIFEMELWDDAYMITENAVISAPDHKDMILPDLHIIEQAGRLSKPTEAD